MREFQGGRMQWWQGRSASKGGCLLALLLVLGFALATEPPTVPGPAAGRPVSAAGDASTAASGDPGSAQLEGYTAATPRTRPGTAGERRASSVSADSTVTKAVDDPRCGIGFTTVVYPTSGLYSCFHTALDPLVAVTPVGAQAAGMAPACHGNGVNGPRLQLVYMYVEGQPDRTAQMVPRIINEFVPRMEAVFRETSKFQGREIGMRLHMPGCKLTVDTVMIDADRGEPGDPFEMSGNITARMQEAGYTSSDRKYVLWFDGGNQGACGVAPALTAGVEQGYNPTPATSSNIGWQAVLPETSITFRYGTPVLGAGFPGMPECWGRGGTGATTELHELLHMIGAVGMSAPNNNGSDAHCLDDNDIMCQVGANGAQKFVRCNTPIEQLDCGSDDYFNVRPAAGSYLSTHWNTANSRFLGDAAVHDAVPAEIPRP